MKHISQQMISMDLRGPVLRRYRAQIKDRLRRPGLTKDEHAQLHRQLKLVGEPKVYSDSEPPPPGAIDPGPMPPVEIELDLDNASYDSLSPHAHSRLYLYARQEGLDVKAGDTKAQVINLILRSIQGEKP